MGLKDAGGLEAPRQEASLCGPNDPPGQSTVYVLSLPLYVAAALSSQYLGADQRLPDNTGLQRCITQTKDKPK